MSAATNAFGMLDRPAVEEILMVAVKGMDTSTLMVAVHKLLSTYKPDLLEELVTPRLVQEPVKPQSTLTALAEAVFIVEDKAKEDPKDELVQEEPEMRTATDENIRRLMKKHRISWHAAWMELRCKELEDGASICCTEECSDRDEADEDLVEAARRGKEKRKAGRHVSYEDIASEGKDSVVKAPYVAPPKVRDAELNWPFMRCKNVANAYKMSMGSSCYYDKIPRNHHGLLEYIASKKKISVETLKNTHPRELFKDNFYVMNALGKSYR